MNKPYISFCIPTFDRLEILKQTIESIYANLEDVEMSEFEVVISDNQPHHSARSIVEKFDFDNLHYYPTDCIGFMNSFNALKNGTGQFLKLHNNYSMLRKGVLKKLIDEIRENVNTKPVIFHTNGQKQTCKIQMLNSYDDFMHNLSYFSSWSAGFGIWREDFDLIFEKIKINNYFPQTSLLFALSTKSNYTINDIPIFDNQHVPNKGGYNIFKVFSVDFVSLIEEEYNKKTITSKTFNRIKFDLLYNYLSIRYFKTAIIRIDKFEKEDIQKSIRTHYSLFSYYAMIFVALFSPFKVFIRKIRIGLHKE